VADDRWAALVDVDGTLLDSNYLHVVAWARAFAAAGRSVPMWEFHQRIGMGADQLLDEIVGGEHPDLEDGWKEQYGRLLGEVGALPRAKDLLAWLVDRGAAVALGTSGAPEFVDHTKELLGEGSIDEIVNSSEVEHSKPQPDIFALALERLGLGPERAVVFGDTEWDIRAATALGVPCVAFCTGGIGEPSLRQAGAVAVYESPAALLEATDHPWLDAVRRAARSR
jgi:HAD superfamily hydrolase (TIGR01549 family)